jgi:adenylyltransferase/sulfurtransferase
MAVGVIKASDLAVRLKTGDVLLVDVREPWENDRAKIEGARLIPLATLPARLGELPKDKEIVFHCHHGMRSMQACQIAAQQGFKVTNLTGGIASWSTEVDPKVPQY